MKQPTALDRANLALAVIDRDIDDKHRPDDVTFRMLADAMHDLYGPLPRHDRLTE